MLDSASIPAKRGATRVGPNPTDRGKPGTKRHLVVERNGLPLATLLTGANRHDSVVFEELLDAIPPIKTPAGRRRKRPDKLHADKAYDIPRCRAPCAGAASGCASPAKASSPASDWAGIAGSSSAPWPGSTTSAG